MRGELVTRAAAEEQPKIPKAINDIVLQALAPDLTARYQRAADLLDDVLAAREPAPRRRRGTAARRRRRRRPTRASPTSSPASRRAKRRSPASAGTAASRCTPARDRCPFCGEAQ